MISSPADFLERLETCMREKSISRSTLAAVSGINLNTVHGFWKYGRFPRGDDLVRIAAVLDTNCEFLVTGTHYVRKAGDRVSEEIADFVHRLDEKERLQVYGALKMLLYLKLTEENNSPV